MTLQELEAVYACYPRKLGQARGMAKARTTIKTQERLGALRTAVSNYRALLAREGTESRFMKHWDTFLGCWTDYLEPENTPAKILPIRPPPVATTAAPPTADRVGYTDAKAAIDRFLKRGLSDPCDTGGT